MIFFVGAGPGAPDLITVRGLQLLKKADLIIYAGSLVSKEHLEAAKPEARVMDSASMTLDEVVSAMADAENRGEMTVRLHTGDPSIYGAIKEQMRELDKLGIEYDVVPGVSSFVAANAAIKAEMTLPGVSQTVILTRMKGRTDVPEKENLRSLASHRASMALFLSVGMIDELVEELKAGYGSEDTPVAVVYRASWPDQKIVVGTLADIAEKVRDAGIKKTAQVLVGDFINSDFEFSKLYDASFSHEFRRAKK